ncbi:CRP/FNR family transcriptional regulator, anaerobic regulatory protein [Flaviramulus basaltis]|uniref:CRP/FNR family transcriptional regulator, anaerobic regulatory protein n=1 Tax=Flaviramulus basaltis TaxID=369401 RepID=A0A1K2IP87_9FLAO|nr:Crp/Fnr family transcriptional regulator [Flaviramulus basaltis]SFZ94249.1 CRP/FNR family transcriptional regulator, anaerobic regulatory protein [Flaviramulus basaltis]
MLEINEKYCLTKLYENPLFKNIDLKKYSNLIKDSSLRTWPKKTCFLDTDKTVNKFNIIISGRLKVYYFDDIKDRKITLFLLSKHDVFDVYHIFNISQHKVYYETLDTSEILSIPINTLKEWMKNNPIFYIGLLQYIIIKMRFLENFVTSSNLDDTSTKLARLLLNYTNETSEKIELINDLPNKELAELIGTTRAVLNRTIQKFKEAGILKIENKQIKIINMKLLLEKLKN